MPWVLLSLYHLILFRRFYFQNPYAYASSELLEQGFASWRVLGRSARRLQCVDSDVYYPDYHSLPFLSSYYPPHVVTAVLGTWLTLDQAWVLYCLTMVAHCWLASVSVYILASAMGLAPLPAGFASVTLSSLGYAMKQNSSIIYTTAWVPTFLLAAHMQHSLVCGISLGLMLLAGYWPIALPALGLGAVVWLMR